MPLPKRLIQHAARSLLPSTWRRKPPPVLVVVEGVYDIEFLRRISKMLHSHDGAHPNLGQMEQRGELVFVPFGGGTPGHWTHRLAGLQHPEFHLYDREVPPETEARQEAAAVVNCRPRCRAVLTSKRNLENYVSPAAIQEAIGVEGHFTDQDNIPELIARRWHRQRRRPCRWEDLPRRAQQRDRNRVKRLLNTKAVDRMTPERLFQQDQDGEVVSWLKGIAQLGRAEQQEK